MLIFCFISAGFLIDVCYSPMFFMALFSLLFAIFHTLIAFTNSFLTLTVCMVATEFVMGMVDTGKNTLIGVINLSQSLTLSGCNVSCLKLWGSDRAGPFFTALHFFFGIGNVLGPLTAEMFLKDSESSKTDFAQNKTKDWIKSDSDGLTDLQNMHFFIGLHLLTVTILFAIAVCFKSPAVKPR